ncbi:MAG: DUF6088 family protein [Methylotenera sp.]|nr:DUF6088 family protein [Methylotenera sp.]
MKLFIKDRINKSIKASKANVFIRADFKKFGGYDQVGRALKEVIEAGNLVKMGYGVYSKTEKSVLSGKPIPVVTITEAGLEVMKKLGVKADVGYFARQYRDGKTIQIPMKEVIAVDKPITRKIYFGKRILGYEKY